MRTDRPLSAGPTARWTPDHTDRRAIVGDLHGRIDLLHGILRGIGAIDERGQRVPGWWLAQIGDLIHGGQFRDRDDECLAEGVRLFDALLLGNHELPHAFVDAEFPPFGGQAPLSYTGATTLAAAIDDDRFRPALAVDGWLVTHAGLHPAHARQEALPENADEAAAALVERFAARIASGDPTPLFDAVGFERGGFDRIGGIFWLDWSVLSAQPFVGVPPQIVGHTPRAGRPTLYGQHLWAIDLGAGRLNRVAALVKQRADAPWRPFVFPDDAR